MVETKTETGKVVWMSKGIGFIARDNGEGDIFVHYSCILMDGYKTLLPNQIVEYEIGENHKGPIAINVRVIKDAPAEETDESEEEDTF
jgi:CspA family cold shock protein